MRACTCGILLLSLVVCAISWPQNGIAEEPALEATLASLDHQMFPFIYLSVAVSRGGEGISTLTKANFQVTENGTLQTDYFDVTPPAAGGGVRAVDIVFLMDNSGSMGNEQDAVREHVHAFVDELEARGVNYQLGLCRFGASENSGLPIIEDGGTLTSDPDYFKNDLWNRNVTSGGFEPGWDALYEAAIAFSFRPGAQKVFILITDETPTDDGNVGHHTQGEAITILQNHYITTFALINLGRAHAISDYGTIAEQTNGEYYNILDPLDSILDYISNLVPNSYRITYKSSNPSYDGVERHVVVTVSYQGEQATCEGTYIPGSAPRIRRTANTLALHTQPWAAGTEFTIEVEITDDVEPYVQSATLYYRTTGETTYTSTPMTHSSNIWTATIPGSAVKAPGLDYYISATDGQSTATSPRVDPRTHPHQLAILPNVAPQITHTPVTTAPANTSVAITAQVVDTTNEVASVELWYRKVGQLVFQKSTMYPIGGDTYSSVIPSSYVTEAGVEYCILARDDLGVGSWHGTPDDPHLITVGSNQPPDTKIETADIDSVKGTATFTWSGTDDTTPTKDLVYSYRLAKDSVYNDWSPWSPATSKTYTDLEPDDYRFQVRAKDAEGAIDGSPASKDFSISAPSTHFSHGTGVHPEEGTPETEFYYTAIIYDSYGRKPSVAAVNIDGRNYAMEYTHEDLAGFHYRYGPVKLGPGEHHYSFHFRIGDEWYWYPEFGERCTGPTVICAKLPDILVTEANRLEQALIGNKAGGAEKDGGLLDQAANGTAKRTADLVTDLGLMLLVKKLKDVLGIPKHYDRFKELNLTYKENFVYDLKGLIAAIKKATNLPADALQPFFESFYRGDLVGADSAEQQIDDTHDVFLRSGLCAPEESVTAARDFLQDARKASQAVFDCLVGIPFAGYDTLAISKTAVTVLQVASVAGGAILGLFTGGGGLTMGVTAAAGLEKVKLGLRLAQAMTVGIMWGLAPTFVNSVSSIAGLSYNLAGQAVETGQITYPKLEFVSLRTPVEIRFGEAKPATVMVRNPSDLDVQVQLYAELETPVLPLISFRISFPVSAPVKIKAGETKTFTFPIFCPPHELFDLSSWVLPKELRVSCYAEYGYLSPYGKRVDLGYSKEVSIKPLMITISKDIYSYINKLTRSQSSAELRTPELDGSSFEVILTVVNHTDHIVNGVTVRDRIPEGMRPFTVRFETPPDEKSPSGDEFTWVLSLKPGERRYLRYTIFTQRVSEGEVYGIPNAEVQFINKEGDVQTARSAGVVDEVYAQQLKIKMLTSLPRSPQVGKEFTVVAVVENPGPDMVNNATVSIRLPRGLDCLGKISQVIESIPAGDTAAVEWDIKASEARAFNIGVEAQASGCAGDLHTVQIKVRHLGEEPPPEYYISLGPNPVPSEGCVFWLNLPENIAQAKLMIFSATGQLLFETPLDVSATRFPSTGTWNPVDQDGVPLANGPYIYVLVADGKVIGQGKMVIQR